MIDLTLLAGTAIALATLCTYINIKATTAGASGTLMKYLSYGGVLAGLVSALYTLWLMTVEVW